jgi:predicted enzyme related to lactoylglutathione lyase
MNNTPVFGFVLEYVTDIEAARRFYVDIVGLEVERQAPAFIQFKNFAIASDASLTGTREPEVYWLVDDVDAVYNQISPKTEVIFPLKQMPFGKVFGIKDPAGKPLFLIQFSRERPSQAVK